MSPEPEYVPRINRDQESDPEVIRALVPPDRRLIRHRDESMDALEANLEFAYCDRRRRRSRRAVLAVLMDFADWVTLAARPGWKRIAERARVSLSTVDRALDDLEAWGVIARIATGRTAEFAEPGADGRKINEAAVYALTVPDDDEPESSVETFGGPLCSPELSGSGPTRARASEPTWGLYAPIRRKRDRLWAAARLRTLAPPLACLTDRALASIIRPYVKAGWVLADVRHALDWLPDGSPSPYGPPPAAELHPARAAGWLGHRLAAWNSPEGRPLPSREAALAAARAAQRHARALEASQARREAAERAQAARTASPARKGAQEAIRASFEAARGRWGRPCSAQPALA